MTRHEKTADSSHMGEESAPITFTQPNYMRKTMIRPSTYNMMTKVVTIFTHVEENAWVKDSILTIDFFVETSKPVNITTDVTK